MFDGFGVHNELIPFKKKKESNLECLSPPSPTRRLCPELVNPVSIHARDKLDLELKYATWRFRDLYNQTCRSTVEHVGVLLRENPTLRIQRHFKSIYHVL